MQWEATSRTPLDHTWEGGQLLACTLFSLLPVVLSSRYLWKGREELGWRLPLLQCVARPPAYQLALLRACLTWLHCAEPSHRAASYLP